MDGNKKESHANTQAKGIKGNEPKKREQKIDVPKDEE